MQNLACQMHFFMPGKIQDPHPHGINKAYLMHNDQSKLLSNWENGLKNQKAW